MYFTSTPSLNSMEAIMKRPPGRNQRGGGRLRKVYPFRKADCDCRLCLYYRKKKGCAMEVCPVLDVRLTCGAASLHEAVYAAFADARYIPFQRRLSHLYDRKDDTTAEGGNQTHIVIGAPKSEKSIRTIPLTDYSAQALILRLAEEQYAALGNEEYETERLRRIFAASECVEELNASILRSTVAEVLVTRPNIKLRLKNGQIIERSDL